MPPEDNGVKFENQGEEFGRPPQESGFDITGLLVSWGLVSSRQEAQYVLMGIAVFALLVAGYLIINSGGGSVPPLLPQ